MVTIHQRFFLTAAIVLALDQLSKYLVRRFFSYTTNTGIAFGFLKEYSSLITVVILFALCLLFYYRKTYPVSLGLLFGGALGNLVDRVFFGAVTDFIEVGFWPSFNLADSANTIGVALLLIHFIREEKKKRTLH
ncbi:MAG: signal peptidase II [Nanoarchaeota archaeon]